MGQKIVVPEGAIAYTMGGERVSIAAGSYVIIAEGDNQWAGYYKVSRQHKHTRRFWVMLDDDA